MRRLSRSLLLAVAVAALGVSVAARAQDELGDTKAAPPSAEDLGAQPKPAEEKKPDAPPAPAPAPAKPKDKPKESAKAPAKDAKSDAKDAKSDGAKKDDKSAKKDGKKDAKEKPAEPEEEPALAPEMQAKVTKLKDEVKGLLVAEPGDARALESVAQSAPNDVMAADPAVRTMVKLAKARALTIQTHYDDAATALSEARALADSVTAREGRRLSAEVRYQLAELDEVKAKPQPSCGALGLKGVAALEGKNARDRVEHLAARYKSVVATGDRFWGRRAAFRTAMLYDELYRFAVGKAGTPAPGALRGVTLPNPFSLATVDSKDVVEAVLGGEWPAEISRLYGEVIASIDARDPDDVLLDQAKKKAAAFARLTVPDGEKATNPWLKDEKAGLVRYHKRYEKKQADGTWAEIDAKEGKSTLLDEVKKPVGSVENAYALVSLAIIGPPPSTEAIAAALASDEARVKLAGLVAAEHQPDPSYLDALVEAAIKPGGPHDKGEPFATLESSLFGTREHALLALRALAGSNREIAQKILDNNKLPPRERAWVVAELGDGRLEYSLQYLAGNSDPTAAATALYALYLSAGKNSLGYLRSNDQGVVGCVSRAIQAIDADH